MLSKVKDFQLIRIITGHQISKIIYKPSLENLHDELLNAKNLWINSAIWLEQSPITLHKIRSEYHKEDTT